MPALGHVYRLGFPPAGLISVVLLAAAVVLCAIAFRADGFGTAVPCAGLFVTSFIAGTMLPFLPGSSEMAMAGLLAAEAAAPSLLITAAIIGNVAGATVNYVVGWNVAHLTDKRWFSPSPIALKRTTEWFRRYGVCLILMCWLPTAGDAITLVAGLLRADFRTFLMLAATGKAFGHVAVAGGVGWIS
jgi:membrane protein YqaA with SNARE-associated domain